MHRVVIADTSCLIIFEKIEAFWILNNLYNEVIITDVILNEYGSTLPSWIKVEKVKVKKYQSFLETIIDSGESSAIALASEKDDVTLILDDLKARKLAKQLGFNVSGSLGVLLKAKSKGIIENIKPYIDKIINTDFRISDKIITELLKMCNE